MKKRNMFFLIMIFIVFISTDITANDKTEKIYISMSYDFGYPSDLMQPEIKTVSKLHEELENNDDYMFECTLKDNIISKNDDKQYTAIPSFVYKSFGDEETMKKFFDKSLFQSVLYEYNGIEENINEICYQDNYFMNPQSKFKETFVFTDNDLFVFDISINKEADENSYNINVSDVMSYDDWIETVIFKPIGTCYINDISVSENVYFNKYEGCVPLRLVIESIGGTVEWDQDKFSAYVNYQGNEYEFKYLFKGYTNGGLVVSHNGISIPLGNQSGVGKCYINDGVTYLSKLSAERFFNEIGYFVKNDTTAKKTFIILK